MKTSRFYLFVLFLFAITAYSADTRIFTYLEPAAPPTVTNFNINQSLAEKFANAEAYVPSFAISANESIKKVKKELMTKYPSGYDFKVFQCTLGWAGISEKKNKILGFQFAFVRSEIVLKKDGPDEIIPCYNLVLPDDTVIEGTVLDGRRNIH